MQWFRDECLEKDEKQYYKKLVEIVNEISSKRKVDKERIHRELIAIKYSCSQKTLMIAYELTKELSEQNYSYFAIGNIGNSYIAYLLGITKFNPLSLKNVDFPYELTFGTKEKPIKYSLELKVGDLDKVKNLIIDTLSRHGEFVWLLGDNFTYLERANNKLRCIINLAIIPNSVNEDIYVPSKVKDDLFSNDVPMHCFEEINNIIPRFSFYNDWSLFMYDRLKIELGKPKKIHNQDYLISLACHYRDGRSKEKDSSINIYELSKLNIRKFDITPLNEEFKSIKRSKRFYYFQELFSFLLKYENDRKTAYELALGISSGAYFTDKRRVKQLLESYKIDDEDIEEISKILYLHDASLSIVDTLNDLNLEYYKLRHKEKFKTIWKNEYSDSLQPFNFNKPLFNWHGNMSCYETVL